VAAERVAICWEGCVVRTLVVVKGSDDAWLVAMGGGSGGEVRRVAEGNGNGGGPKTDRGSGGDIPRGVLVVRTIGWDGMDLWSGERVRLAKGRRGGRREVDGGTGAGVGAKGGRFGGGEFHCWWNGGDSHRLDMEEKSDGRITGTRNGVRLHADARGRIGNEGRWQ
jgi:hypothetical protein